MARIIVTTEQGERHEAPVLLDERVCAEHLTDSHAAKQLIQRLGWAVADADDAERALGESERALRESQPPLDEPRAPLGETGPALDEPAAALGEPDRVSAA